MTSSAYVTIALPDSAPASARAVFRLIDRLRYGSLDVHLPDGTRAHFGAAAAAEPRAAIHLRNWKVCAAALGSGDIGFAKTFIDGDWAAPDLTTLLLVVLANRDLLETAVYGSWRGSLRYRLRHRMNRNSRSGSRENAHAHYHLGNDFFRLWLDETMSYSSAWFDGDFSLRTEAAQQAKLRRALREAAVVPGARVLDLGCGWGALAELAVSEFGAHVTALTLSSEQLVWAQRRLQRAGAAANVDLRYQDYREIGGETFDAIVSIEMFEAVGREYWANYFETLRRCLKPDGRALVQTVTIRDDLFDRYARSTDFIQQNIFPGGMLPCIGACRAEAERRGLAVKQVFAFGADYAETLKRWRERFLAQEARVRSLGFDTRFMRTWEFYLAYCEAAFRSGNTDVVQFTLERS